MKTLLEQVKGRVGATEEYRRPDEMGLFCTTFVWVSSRGPIHRPPKADQIHGVVSGQTEIHNSYGIWIGARLANTLPLS